MVTISSERGTLPILYASVRELRALAIRNPGCVICHKPVHDDSTVQILAQGVLAHLACLKGKIVSVI